MSFESLLREILVDNLIHERGADITPLNADEISQEFYEKDMKSHEIDAEVYAGLIRTQGAIAHDGGIAEAVYEAERYAINAVARRKLGLTSWAGYDDGTFMRNQDREGRLVTPEQVARFPKDGDYSWTHHKDCNIMDPDFRHGGWEGTLYQVEFKKGLMSLYRMFNQSHRNHLHVRTLPIPDMLKAIDTFVQDFKPVERITFSLPLTPQQYLGKIREFNETYGSSMLIEQIRSKPWIVLPTNPDQTADIFRGGDVKKFKGRISPSVSREYQHIDLFLRRHIGCGFQEPTPYDPDKDKDEPTLIIGYHEQDLVIGLLKKYKAAVGSE